MSITRPSASHQLRVVHWGQGHAIRSGANPQEAVGLTGLIEEVHYARAFSTRCLGGIRTPDGDALWSEAAGTITKAITYPVVMGASPDVLRLRAFVDCEDATVYLDADTDSGAATDNDTQVGRGQLTLEVAAGSPGTHTLLVRFSRRAVATTGVIYGVVFYEDTVTAGELAA